MKLIGIIGKSGSGKTTLANMLQKDENIGVIHLDSIIHMNEIKQKLPNKLVDEDQHTNNQGENFLMLSGNLKSIKDKIISNPYINKIYTGLLKIPREMLLRKNIKENEDKKVLIVERSFSCKVFCV
jgi:dephospho-CoA kinase